MYLRTCFHVLNFIVHSYEKSCIYFTESIVEFNSVGLRPMYSSLCVECQTCDIAMIHCLE